MTPLRIALRSLSRSPLFTLAAVGALALGIGVNTAIYSALYGLLLHPKFIDDPDRLSFIGADYTRRGVAGGYAAVVEVNEALAARDLFEHAAVQGWNNFTYTPPGGVPERLVANSVSPSYFDVYGARPLLGRTLRPGDDEPGRHRVIVLTYAAWQRHFGGDRGVVGKQMLLNGEPFEVVGVMQPEFDWPPPVEAWHPMTQPPGFWETQPKLAGGYSLYVRLRPGVTRARAEAEMQARVDRALSGREREMAREGGRLVRVRSFAASVAQRAQVQPAVLIGAVLFVLLIACANVAGLVLARGAERAPEIATRAALGAGRWQLMQPVLVESVCLAAAGVAGGIAFAWTLLRVLVAVAPAQEVPERLARLDLPVLGAAALAGLLSAAAFGLPAAWQDARPLARFRGRQCGRSVLVVAQVALALVLLVGAGLFLRSLGQMQAVDAGFDMRGLMTAELQAPIQRGKPGEMERMAQLWRSVLERLTAQPGVTGAALAGAAPLSGGDVLYPFLIPGRDLTGDPFYADGRIAGAATRITPGYFATLGVAMRAGREFDGSPEQVAVVDEALAARYFPRGAVGEYLQLSPTRTLRIVGVAPTVRQTLPGLDANRPRFYLPMLADAIPYAAFLVRGSGNLGRAIRTAVRDADPSLAVYSAQPLEERVHKFLAVKRIAAWLLAFFGAAALFLAALGLYGVVSYSVSRRTQEIGIRMALGARAQEIERLVVAQGLWLASAGALLGLGGAMLVGRAIARQLYRVPPFDPVSFGGMAALLMAVAVLASWIPARRAARVNPVVALRRE
ncbi:MAG: ABC transporter permease [Bryobacterales bacterium]|nr:ABC transporter permease [Bryobacterales bacterium]